MSTKLKNSTTSSTTSSTTPTTSGTTSGTTTTFFETVSETISNHPKCNLTKSEVLAILVGIENCEQEIISNPKSKAKVKATVSPKNLSNKNVSSTSDDEKYSESTLRKMKVAELKDICAELRISKTGTKDTLVKKILGNDSNKPVVKKVASYMLKTIETFSSSTGSGNCIMAETGFVFDKKVDKVVGKEVEKNGKIVVQELTEEDIEVVRQYGLEYDYPSNLDSELTQVVDDDEPEVFDTIEDEEEDDDDEEEDFIVDDDE